MVEIHPQVVEKFQLWSKYPTNQSTSHDKIFVRALLYCFAKEEVNEGQTISEETIRFIRGNFLFYSTNQRSYF